MRSQWNEYLPYVDLCQPVRPFVPPVNADVDPKDHPYVHLGQQYPDLLIVSDDGHYGLMQKDTIPGDASDPFESTPSRRSR